MTEVQTEVKARRFELTVEEREQRLVDLQEMLHDMIVGLTGQDSITVGVPTAEAWQASNEITFYVTVQTEEQLRLTIGPRKSLVQTLLMFLRLQQIMPHNKVITLVVRTDGDGRIQMFKDAHCFGSNPRNVPVDDFYRMNGIAAPHFRTNVSLPKSSHIPKSQSNTDSPKQDRKGATRRDKTK